MPTEVLQVCALLNIFLCACALFPALCCSAVQYLTSACGEHQLEGDLRIKAILKQNTTCQIFTPSLPCGNWTGLFS